MTSRQEQRRFQPSESSPSTAGAPSSPEATAPRKPYARPAIIHELALETRAGSPLGIPNPFDPVGLGGE